MTRPTPNLALTTGAKPPPDTDWLTTTEVADGHAETVKEHVSTGLSTVALIGVAVGVGWGLWAHLGPWSVAVGSAVLAVLVAAADWLRAPRHLPLVDDDGPPVPPRLVPGPTDPGNLHAKGPGAAR